MASPKGSYTPKSGAFSGRTFPSYFAYQTARAQSLGYKSYSQQRAVTGVPYIQNLINRAVHQGGMSRQQATIAVRQWYATQPQPAGPGGAQVAAQPYRGRAARRGDPNHSRSQGLRKRAAIKFALDMGWYDNAEDAEQEIDY